MSSPAGENPSFGSLAWRAAGISVAGFLLVAIALRWNDEMHWHDSQRIGQFFLYLLLALIVIVARRLRALMMQQAAKVSRTVGWLLAAGAGAGLVSALTCGFPREALLEVSLLLMMPLIVLLMMAVREATGQRFDTFALALTGVAGAVLAAPFLVATVAALTSGSGFFLEYLYRSGFSNPRFFGQFHSIVLPLLALACLWSAFPQRYRGVAFAVLVLTWVMALITATRATWFATGGALAVIMVLSPAITIRLLKVQAAALALATLLTWLLFDMAPAYLYPEAPRALGVLAGRFADPFALSSRDLLWARAIELITLHPWLGIGPMGLALDFNTVAAHPHNAPLQLAAEWGVPASLALLLAVALLAARMAVSLAREGRAAPPFPSSARLRASTPERMGNTALATALFAALIAAGITAMVDGVLVMPYTQVLLSTTAGWAASLLLPAERNCCLPSGQAGTAGRESPGSGVHSGQMATGLAVVAALLAAALAAGAGHQVLQVQARDDAFKVDYPHLRYNLPRFWTQGWIIEAAGSARRLEPAAALPVETGNSVKR